MTIYKTKTAHKKKISFILFNQRPKITNTFFAVIFKAFHKRYSRFYFFKQKKKKHLPVAAPVTYDFSTGALGFARFHVQHLSVSIFISLKFLYINCI